jgi:TetR/AcrR family transcriptional repressor of nem operon
MARTKQFDERQALVSAMLVFWENGYEGTSIQDLEAAMGLKRTSIYNAFGNKRRLFERVLACYQESIIASLLDALDGAPDIREGVRRLLNAALDIHFDEQYPGGCLIALSLLESGQHDARSRASMVQTMRDLGGGLQARLARARQAGELPADLDTASTANAIVSTMAGMMVMGKAGFTKPALKKTASRILALLGPAAAPGR